MKFINKLLSLLLCLPFVMVASGQEEPAQENAAGSNLKLGDVIESVEKLYLATCNRAAQDKKSSCQGEARSLLVKERQDYSRWSISQGTAIPFEKIGGCETMGVGWDSGETKAASSQSARYSWALDPKKGLGDQLNTLKMFHPKCSANFKIDKQNVNKETLLQFQKGLVLRAYFNEQLLELLNQGFNFKEYKEISLRKLNLQLPFSQLQAQAETIPPFLDKVLNVPMNQNQGQKTIPTPKPITPGDLNSLMMGDLYVHDSLIAAMRLKENYCSSSESRGWSLGPEEHDTLTPALREASEKVIQLKENVNKILSGLKKSLEKIQSADPTIIPEGQFQYMTKSNEGLDSLMKEFSQIIQETDRDDIGFKSLGAGCPTLAVQAPGDPHTEGSEGGANTGKGNEKAGTAESGSSTDNSSGVLGLNSSGKKTATAEQKKLDQELADARTRRETEEARRNAERKRRKAERNAEQNKTNVTNDILLPLIGGVSIGGGVTMMAATLKSMKTKDNKKKTSPLDAYMQLNAQGEEMRLARQLSEDQARQAEAQYALQCVQLGGKFNDALKMCEALPEKDRPYNCEPESIFYQKLSQSNCPQGYRYEVFPDYQASTGYPQYLPQQPGAGTAMGPPYLPPEGSVMYPGYVCYDRTQPMQQWGACVPYLPGETTQNLPTSTTTQTVPDNVLSGRDVAGTKGGNLPGVNNPANGGTPAPGAGTEIPVTTSPKATIVPQNSSTTCSTKGTPLCQQDGSPPPGCSKCSK